MFIPINPLSLFPRPPSPSNSKAVVQVVIFPCHSAGYGVLIIRRNSRTTQEGKRHQSLIATVVSARPTTRIGKVCYRLRAGNHSSHGCFCSECQPDHQATALRKLRCDTGRLRLRSGNYLLYLGAPWERAEGWGFTSQKQGRTPAFLIVDTRQHRRTHIVRPRSGAFVSN